MLHKCAENVVCANLRLCLYNFDVRSTLDNILCYYFFSACYFLDWLSLKMAPHKLYVFYTLHFPFALHANASSSSLLYVSLLCSSEATPWHNP